MPSHTSTSNMSLAGALAVFAFIFSAIAAYITHLVWIIQTLSSDAGATTGQIVMAVIGVFVAPLGVIHGFMIWFGAGL